MTHDLFTDAQCATPTSLHLLLLNDSPKCDILGCGTRGGAYDPKFKLGRDFCTMHLDTKFNNPMFNRLEVNVLTKNKKMLL